MSSRLFISITLTYKKVSDSKNSSHFVKFLCDRISIKLRNEIENGNEDAKNIIKFVEKDIKSVGWK